MNFELIKNIIARQGFYVLSLATYNEIRYGSNTPGQPIVLPYERSFNHSLLKHGLTVTKTTDPQILLIKEVLRG